MEGRVNGQIDGCDCEGGWMEVRMDGGVNGQSYGCLHPKYWTGHLGGELRRRTTNTY
jgi:hypothetical protein